MTVYHDDDESIGLWRRITGIPQDRIVRRGMKDNFWSMGVPGRRGRAARSTSTAGRSTGPTAARRSTRTGSRVRTVFMQFERGEGGVKEDYPLLRELPAKSIDTGMGLERMAFLLQGVQNLYEIDEVFPVIARVQEISGRRYGADHDDDVRMRVVADHVRSGLCHHRRRHAVERDARVRAAAAAAPRGALAAPARRRRARAARPRAGQRRPHARKPPQVEASSAAPRRSSSRRRSFRRTLSSGTTILDTAVRRAKSAGRTVLSGEDAFALHDYSVSRST